MSRTTLNYARVLFTESQPMRGRTQYIGAGVAFIAIGGVAVLMFVGVSRPPWPVVVVMVAALAYIAAGLASTLVVVVTTAELVVRVAPWPWTRRIPHAQIARHEAVTYNAAFDHGGRGARKLTDGSWVYTARGDRGVRVYLVPGKLADRLFIGSQRADELAAALSEAKGNDSA